MTRSHLYSSPVWPTLILLNSPFCSACTHRHTQVPSRTALTYTRQGLGGHDIDFETTWNVLERAFTEIHTKNASQLSFEELYRNAYKIVLKKKGEELYYAVVNFERNWLKDQVLTKILGSLTTPLLLLHDGRGTSLSSVAQRRSDGETFLWTLKEAWEEHQVCMGMLTDVLMYMVGSQDVHVRTSGVTDIKEQDRVYCTDHRQPSIFAKAMGLFRDQILKSQMHSTLLVDTLTGIILDQIQMDRDGENIDQFLIKANIYMLEGLYESDQEVEEEKLYLKLFEQRFLHTSALFYREEGDRLLKESDAGTYCKEAKRRLDEESDRCRSTISESTAPRIQRVVEDELIRHKMKGLIEMDSGVKHMIENDKFYELRLVYDLEARVDPRKSELTKALQGIIHDIGLEINRAAEATSQAPPAAPVAQEEGGEEKTKPGATRQINQQTVAALKWVEDILALKARFDRLWTRSFYENHTISTALTRSISDIINGFSRNSEYISLFIDENMKKGIRDKTEAEIDATLEEAITTLRYLQDKDMFETYYKKHLCKRLLLKKSQSIDVEKQMISRMKIELGNSFTLKLEAMFKDMTLSEELTSGYKDHVARLGQADSKRVDLSINVLTSMTWPLEAFRGASDDERDGRPTVIFPGSIERIRTGFERFYAEKYSGRKLTWQTNMGDADIKATFPRSRNGKPMTHDINCSTYSMLILLLFNDLPPGASLSFEEIQARTNIPENDLKRNLQSLAVAKKTQLLMKDPMTREINAGDKFFYNENFSSKIIKIKVGVVSAGNKVEGDRERKETEKKNSDSRGFAIEAAVVRIMKYVPLTYVSDRLSPSIPCLPFL